MIAARKDGPSFVLQQKDCRREAEIIMHCRSFPLFWYTFDVSYLNANKICCFSLFLNEYKRQGVSLALDIAHKNAKYLSSPCLEDAVGRSWRSDRSSSFKTVDNEVFFCFLRMMSRRSGPRFEGGGGGRRGGGGGAVGHRPREISYM